MRDDRAGRFVCDFIELLKHSDGQWAGKPFDLLEWQQQIVGDFYSELKDDGYRQYQYLYLEIPKKNGKTELAAALSLYHLIADGENGGEVYLCAADKENASIAYRAAVGMVESSKALSGVCRLGRSTKTITHTKSGSILKVMSSDAFSKHGYKPSCVIFDELHAQPKRDLWDVMTFGAGSARAQPVWIVLTTAGDDPNRASIGWEIHEKARKILTGELIDPVWMPVIYGMPDDQDEIDQIDIYDEALWYKCNPSLGHTIQIDTLRQEALNAQQSEGGERLFRWLRLNQWISVKTLGWLPLTLFDNTIKVIPREKLVGLQCFSGLDLSSTTDLTAEVNIFPPQGWLTHWHVIFDPYVPRDKIKERVDRDKVPMDQWVKDGFVIATEGDAIDYDLIESNIKNKAKNLYKYKVLGPDPWNSQMLTQHLICDGINVVEVPQTFGGMSPPMKEIERLLRKGEMTHEKNPCARWCFGNVRCLQDNNANIRPTKKQSIDRIDVMVGWINAMAVAMQNPASVYEGRGLRVI